MEDSWTESYLKLRAAVANGDVPADIGAFALSELAATAPHHRRVAVRDHLLVAAARFLEGSNWARAGELREELLNLDRRHGALGQVRQLLSEAQAISPMPTSQRMLYKIIAESELEAVDSSDVLRAASIS